MRRVSASLAALTLVLAACGGDDDDSGSDAAPAATAATDETDETGDDAGTDDAGTDDAGDGDDAATSDDGGDGGDDVDDGGDGDDPVMVDSLDDVPQQCKDLMAEFLQSIEPVVSPIDWDNASLADFEQVATEFEAQAEAFEAATEADDDCNIEVEEADDFDLIVEFAGDVAPGTVQFLEFVSGFMSAVAPDDAGGDDAGDDGETAMPGGDAAFEDCDGAIAYIEELMGEYGSMMEMPVDDIMALSEIGMVMMSCTPEQLEFFNSPDVEAFFDG